MAITARLARAWISGVVTCLVLLGLASGGLGAAASAAPAGRPAIPTPGQSSLLRRIACPSPASCWAVGSYTTASGTVVDEILHWNGRRWSQFPAPSPGGSSQLRDVSCISPVACWAIGRFNKPGGPVLNQVLRWDGRRWSLAPAPDPGGAAAGDFNQLNGVGCSSTRSCFAVGEYIPGSGAPTLNQVLRWDGRRWSLARSPDPGGTAAGDLSDLADVRCASPASCWAVGFSLANGQAGLNEVLHWNGRHWSLVPAPDPGGTASGDFSELGGIACPSPGSCLAVGDYGTGTIILNQVLRWNGRRWSLVRTPDPGSTGAAAGDFLSGVACTSTASCWAVGFFEVVSVQGLVENQVLFWNGRTWFLDVVPNPAGMASGDNNALHGVRCTSPASCWAVGSDAPNGQSERNQVLHLS